MSTSNPIDIGEIDCRAWISNINLFFFWSTCDHTMPPDVMDSEILDLSPRIFRLRKRIARCLPARVQTGISCLMARLG